MRSADIEADVARSFGDDVAGHRMIVRHDQGLYRHLVFEQREDSWNNRFELITTPGTLTIVGDRGGHIFRRLTDMFQFFRSNPDRPHRIDVGYWAEKTPDHGRSVKVYSEELTRQLIAEHLQEAVQNRDALLKEFQEENERQHESWREDLHAEGIEEGDPDYPPPTPERLEDWPELLAAIKLVERAAEEIQNYEDDGMLGYEDGARQLLDELDVIGLVSDTWEWDLHDWDYHFVWCLNAISWGIQQYDSAIRAGLHVRRTGPMPWDVPLPTTPPAGWQPRPSDRDPIRFEIVLMSATPRVVTAEIQEGLL